MATPTSVDQTVQRDRPDQADPPGSPHTKDLIEEADDGYGPPSGPDTPDAAAEPSTLSLSSSSSSSSSSSPQNEDSPREASSSSPPDSDSDSDYGSDSSDDEPVTAKRAEARAKGVADSVADMEHETGGSDKTQQGTSPAATRGWQSSLGRPLETCLGAGWSAGDALPNRSFANEHIAVARSALQGYGVFAASDIKEGTQVLVEAPLLCAKGLEKLCAKHARLDGEQRAVYDGLVGYHEWDTCPVRQKWSANSFDLARGYNGVFAIASNFNHACRAQRNTKYDWDERQQAMAFTTIRDIEEGAELLVSYCDYRHVLKAVYGFVCHCGGCEGLGADLGASGWY